MRQPLQNASIPVSLILITSFNFLRKSRVEIFKVKYHDGQDYFVLACNAIMETCAFPLVLFFSWPYIPKSKSLVKNFICLESLTLT